MRRVEFVLLCAVALPAFAQTNSVQNYNGTDTFVPGKKYTCVPTPDRKGWDCNEAGKTVQARPKDSGASASSPSPPPPDPAPPPQPASRSTLPSYLTNAAASTPAPIGEPPSTVSAAAAHANAPASAPIATPPASTTRSVAHQSSPAVAATPPPRPPTKPPVSPRVTHPPLADTAAAGGDFMTLPGDHFVVEIARASGQSELDAVRSATHVAQGDLYEVHLRQNGADAWLLLWGSFDTLDAARAARTTLTNTAPLPGWPRRIAPLQAEARRVSP